MLQTDRRTDGQTDGAGYIGPADRQGGSKNQTSDLEVGLAKEWMMSECYDAKKES